MDLRPEQQPTRPFLHAVQAPGTVLNASTPRRVRQAMYEISKALLNPAARPQPIILSEQKQQFLKLFAEGNLNYDQIQQTLRANPRLAKVQDNLGNTALHLLILNHYDHKELLDTAIWLVNSNPHVIKIQNNKGETPVSLLFKTATGNFEKNEQVRSDFLKIAMLLTNPTKYNGEGGFRFVTKEAAQCFFELLPTQTTKTLDAEAIVQRIQHNPGLATIKDDQDQTPLQRLVQYNYNHEKTLTIIDALIKAGADFLSTKIKHNGSSYFITDFASAIDDTKLVPYAYQREHHQNTLHPSQENSFHNNLIHINYPNQSSNLVETCRKIIDESPLIVEKKSVYDENGSLHLLFSHGKDLDDLLPLTIHLLYAGPKKILFEKNRYSFTPIDFLYKNASTHKDFLKILVLLLATAPDCISEIIINGKFSSLTRSQISNEQLLLAIKLILASQKEPIELVIKLIHHFSMIQDLRETPMYLFSKLIKINGSTQLSNHFKNFFSDKNKIVQHWKTESVQHSQELKTKALVAIYHFINATNAQNKTEEPDQNTEVQTISTAILNANKQTITDPLSEDCPYPPLFCAIALSDHAGFEACIQKGASFNDTTDNLPGITAADFYIELDKIGLITQEFKDQIKKIQMQL